MTKTFTVDEAAVLMGVSRKSIYKYIKSGKLPFTGGKENGKSFKLIKEEDLKQFISNRLITSDSPVNNPSKSGESIDIKQLVKEAIQEQQSMIMKPLEEQALYRLGILENEVKHLQAEKETLRLENMDLQEQMKLLPDLKEVLLLREENEQYRVSLSAVEVERQKLKEDLAKAEQEKIEIANTWKKELEEARKPWWRWW